MKSKRVWTIAIVTALVSALGGSAVSAQAAQDKYTLQVPGGLAFSSSGDTRPGRSSPSVRTDP